MFLKRTTSAVFTATSPVMDLRPFAVRRFGLLLVACGLLIAALLVLHIVVGTVELTPLQVWKALMP
ncbi:MAG: hypothetical protein HC828_15395, partial [Blastochloris sp.]|nr:hypothetical protein [Blastochloris sp.]